MNPFPDVSRQVIEPVSVGRKLLDRTMASIAVQRAILLGKGALPEVSLVYPVRGEFVAPGVRGSLEPASRRVLELGLGRQTRSSPLAVGVRVLP